MTVTLKNKTSPGLTFGMIALRILSGGNLVWPLRTRNQAFERSLVSRIPRVETAGVRDLGCKPVGPLDNGFA